MNKYGIRSLVAVAVALALAALVFLTPTGPAETMTGVVSGQFSMTPRPSSSPSTSAATKPKAVETAPTAGKAKPSTGTAKPSTGKAKPSTGKARPTGTKVSPKAAKPTSLADRQWEMVPMPALPPYTDAAIKNSPRSTHPLKVCRDWDKTSCRRGSPSGELKPGENSSTKFGWPDTDGFRRDDHWVKEHGCFGCVVTVTVR